MLCRAVDGHRGDGKNAIPAGCYCNLSTHAPLPCRAAVDVHVVRRQLDAVVLAREVDIDGFQVRLLRRLGDIECDVVEDIIAVRDACIQSAEVETALRVVCLLEEGGLLGPGGDIGANEGGVVELLWRRVHVRHEDVPSESDEVSG